MPYIMNYFEHPVTNAYTESLNNLIRVMNRIGRGYSFEALRAKILFTEGVHKHTLSRPKFERRPAANERMRLGRMVGGGDGGFFAKAVPERWAPEKLQKPIRPSTNYGADISALISWLELGKL